MNHNETMAAILKYIDDNLTTQISTGMIAEKAGYSSYHFSRIFTETIGISVMSYVTWRKLGDFNYMLGRGIDHPDDLLNIQSDMTRIDIAGGLYAVFSTPPVADSYIQVAQETWNEIFLHWLPQSEFEFDDTRYDFEYHDYRDHGYYFDGKLQIDICIPIRQKKKKSLNHI